MHSLITTTQIDVAKSKTKKGIQGKYILHLRANLQVKIRITKGCKFKWNKFDI